MGLWLAQEPLVLASKSAIRRQMLEAADIPIEAIPADIDERQLEMQAVGASPAEIAALLAVAKAQAVSRNAPGRIVLGADQTLAFEGRVFSKPADREAARAQLLSFRGGTHELHSAAAVVRSEQVLFMHISTAVLTVRTFSEAFLDRYLDTAGEAVLQSVGAYQLERAGVHLFASIAGDHFTILGLPMLPLLGFLRQQDFLAA
jgi:septum formation protein